MFHIVREDGRSSSFDTVWQARDYCSTYGLKIVREDGCMLFVVATR